MGALGALLPRWAWIAIGVGLVLAALAWAVVAVLDGLRDDRATAHDAGRTTQQAEDLKGVITSVEEANEVRSKVEAEARDGRGQHLYDECVRSARNPKNCQRFLPE